MNPSTTMNFVYFGDTFMPILSEVTSKKDIKICLDDLIQTNICQLKVKGNDIPLFKDFFTKALHIYQKRLEIFDGTGYESFYYQAIGIYDDHITNIFIHEKNNQNDNLVFEMNYLDAAVIIPDLQDYKEFLVKTDKHTQFKKINHYLYIIEKITQRKMKGIKMIEKSYRKQTRFDQALFALVKQTKGGV